MKLDLGCGPNKKEGFTGVDVLPFDGKVDVVMNVGTDPWPWEDDSVEEAHCSHMIEHLEWPERVHFFNELGRVMKRGAKCQMVLPHWNSARYYGDPTHKSPMSEWAFFYLLASWRETNAPHVSYTCDFDVTYGYTLRPDLTVRNAEYQSYAMSNFKEACQDIVATLVKR
jgi:hypothetical protein